MSILNFFKPVAKPSEPAPISAQLAQQRKDTVTMKALLSGRQEANKALRTIRSERRRDEFREFRSTAINNKVQFDKFKAGTTATLNQKVNSLEQLRNSTRMIQEHVQETGAKLVLQAGERYITITPENLARYNTFTTLDITDNGVDNEEDSLAQAAREATASGSISVSSVTGAYDFRSGAFFPYTHNFKCEELTEQLEALGCYTYVKSANYKKNCLQLAFEQAGVSGKIIEALKQEILRRVISRKNLKILAEKHDLYITIRTEGDKDVVKFGNKENKPIELALIEGHYIHFTKTKINAFALKNYKMLCQWPDWWEFRDMKRRDPSRGMNSLQFLRECLNTGMLSPILNTTARIFTTPFYDKCKKQSDFATLDYHEKYSRLHVKQDTEEVDFGLEDCDEETQKRLQEKYDAQTDGEKPFLGHEDFRSQCRKAKAVAANVFFDFETSTKSDYKNDEELIEACKKQILKVCIEPEKIIEKIETQKTDIGTKALKYMQACPHTAYQVAFADSDEAPVAYDGIDCAKQMLNTLVEKYGSQSTKNIPEIRMLAHNVTYDFSFIAEHLHSTNFVCKGASIIAGSAVYTRWGNERDESANVNSEGHKAYKPNLHIKLLFRDTLKMISMPLSQFGSSFNLDSQKEAIPYELFTREFIERGGIATEQELRTVEFFEDHETLFSNIKKWNCEVPGGYDMMKYSRIYCIQDVVVLRDGWKVFRDGILKEFNIDCYHYCTLASVADRLLVENGCYQEVHEIGGTPQRFIARCTIGGRVMCANNQKSEVQDETDDFDAVSQYPSAMASMPGFLKGAPKVWTKDIDLEKVDGYFVQIRVSKVGSKYPLPITRIKSEDGANNWTNELENKTLYVDKNTLEDLVEHSQLEFEVLSGYYFDEDYNKTINSFIKKLFDLRITYKKVGNPMQKIIKLLMNSSYGKTGLKAVETDTRYVKSDKLEAFVSTNFNSVKEYTQLNNREWRAELYKEVDTHYNRQHIACTVLSESKKNINKVTCTAHHIGCPIYYTDTDSLHVKTSKIPELAAEFERRYGRELIGDAMGQFNSDFEWGGCYQIIDGKLKPAPNIKTGELHAKHSLFLGKKAYIDEVTDGENTALHIRMKGVPLKTLINRCNKSYAGDAMALFKHMFKGNPEWFKLGSEGHVMFQNNKNHTISTSRLTRKVKF